MAKRQPDDYIKRRDVIRAMHEKHPSWGDSNYNFIRDIPSADVYTREEVIAMLTELQTEIEEWSFPENAQNKNRMVYMKRVDEVIQQKIDKMRGDKDETILL